MSVFTVPRETSEAVPFLYELGGVNLTTGVTYALVPSGTRPSSFSAAVTWNSNYPCFVITAGMTPGRYKLYAQTTSSPYTPTRFIQDVIID